MQLKTSYFKKEMWKQSFHSSGWIGIAYFVALFFILPLEILTRLSEEDNQQFSYSPEKVDNLLYVNAELQVIICLIIPVLAAIFTCRYMQVKGSADFVHSLPLKRSQLFNHQFVWGIMMLLLPIVIIAFLLFFMYGIIDVDDIYQHQDIWNWLVMMITVNTLIYAVAFLIGILTGISTVQGLLSYIILFFPAGIIILIAHNIDMLLFGFDNNYIWDMNLANISPLIWMLDMQYESDLLTSSQLIYYWSVTIICVVLAYWLYKIRDVELANQSLVFPILKPIFKFGVTFCFMLLGGVYFGATQDNLIGWLMFGYIFGALLGYILAEMLLQKTWRIFHQWKGFIIYTGISLIVLSSFVFDWFGYEERIPDQEEVKKIFFQENEISYKVGEININDLTIVQHVLDIHQYLIDHKELYQNTQNIDNKNATSITLTYVLKNGRELHRNYYVPDRTEIEQNLKPVIESDSYKQSTAGWLYDDSKGFDRLYIHGVRTSKEIVDQKVISKLREALKVDYLNASYQEIEQGTYNPTFSIEFMENNQYYSQTILNNFDSTRKVLEEENLAGVIDIKPADVRTVVVVDSKNNTVENNQMIIEEQAQKEDIIKLQEKEAKDGSWEIALFGPEPDLFLTNFYLHEEDIPDFVKEHFEE